MVTICAIALNSYHMLNDPCCQRHPDGDLSTAANVVHIVCCHYRLTELVSKTMPSFIMRYHSVRIENSTPDVEKRRQVWYSTNVPSVSLYANTEESHLNNSHLA